MDYLFGSAAPHRANSPSWTRLSGGCAGLTVTPGGVRWCVFEFFPFSERRRRRRLEEEGEKTSSPASCHVSLRLNGFKSHLQPPGCGGGKVTNNKRRFDPPPTASLMWRCSSTAWFFWSRAPCHLRFCPIKNGSCSFIYTVAPLELCIL